MDGTARLPLPIAFPPGEKWFVRIIGSRKRLVFGVYRRHRRTIGYLGEIDGFFGAPATTRRLLPRSTLKPFTHYPKQAQTLKRLNYWNAYR